MKLLVKVVFGIAACMENRHLSQRLGTCLRVRWPVARPGRISNFHLQGAGSPEWRVIGSKYLNIDGDGANRAGFFSFADQLWGRRGNAPTFLRLSNSTFLPLLQTVPWGDGRFSSTAMGFGEVI